MKKKVIEVSADVYNRKVVVVVGYSEKEVLTLTKTTSFKRIMTDSDRKVIEDNIDCAGMCVRLTSGRVFIWIHPKYKKEHFYGVLAHELLHATDYILHYSGLTLDRSSVEAYTYLMGHLTKEVHVKLA